MHCKQYLSTRIEAHLTRPYKLDKERIRVDLGEDRPRWILSSYSPTAETPRQLFGGETREQSYEELRLRHYELALNGQEQQADQEAKTAYRNAEQQIRAALNDLDGAIKYIIDGRNDHPNRIDICREATKLGYVKESTGLHAQSHPSSSQQLQTMQSSAFGQPSALGRADNPFARNPATHAVFGRPSQPGIGQESPFGLPKNPFASTRDAPQPNFGTPAFTASTLASSSAPNTMDFSPTKTSGFGQGSSFDHDAGRSKNPFAQTGSTAPSRPVSLSNGPSAGFPSAPVTMEAAAVSSSHGQKDALGHLTSWRGNRVSYIEGKPCFKRADGNWERVWFPEAPKLDMNEDIPNTMYTEALEEKYRYMQQHGSFAGGLIPEMPPKKEWCHWNF